MKGRDHEGAGRYLYVLVDGRRCSRAFYASAHSRHESGQVYLSAASVWEIAVKHALGKLPLPEPPRQFVPAQRTLLALTALPIEEVAVLALDRLPALHRDPFDRVLVCQALTHGLVIVSPDPQIQQYPISTLW